MAELTRMICSRSFRRFGFPPGGNAALADALGSYITDNGGTVITGARVKDIFVKDNRVKKIMWGKDGKLTESHCDFAVSNMGVGQTQKMIATAAFSSEEIKTSQEMKASYTLTIDVFSDRPLIDFPGVLMLPNGKKAAFITCPTLICPEWAPSGKHLTIVLGPPAKSEEPFNGKEEFKYLLEDAKTYLPGFDEYVTGWLTRSFRKNWPGFRARPGFDAPRETNITNLYNVGDSVKPPGLYGVGGCAESAMHVTQKIQERLTS